MAPGAPWQDADEAYAVKVELQAKVDSLEKDIKFLKCLYDAVRTFLPHPSQVFPAENVIWLFQGDASRRDFGETV